MRYSVYQAVPFSALDHVNVKPLDFLALVLDDCRARLRAHGIGVYNADVSIRPFPRNDGEGSRNGYDRLVPRVGLEVIMTSETA